MNHDLHQVFADLELRQQLQNEVRAGRRRSRECAHRYCLWAALENAGVRVAFGDSALQQALEADALAAAIRHRAFSQALRSNLFDASLRRAQD